MGEKCLKNRVFREKRTLKNRKSAALFPQKKFKKSAENWFCMSTLDVRLDGMAIRKLENRKLQVFSGHSVLQCSGNVTKTSVSCRFLPNNFRLHCSEKNPEFDPIPVSGLPYRPA